MSYSRWFPFFQEIPGVLRSVFFLTALIALETPVAAQTVDTVILGTITDSAGAVITGGTVTLTQAAKGLSRTARTGADGAYEFRYLLPGEYAVEVKATGFNAERRSGVTIQLGQQAKIDFSLTVGGVRQTVDVTAAPPLLQTENASLGNVVGPDRIENLPPPAEQTLATLPP